MRKLIVILLIIPFITVKSQSKIGVKTSYNDYNFNLIYAAEVYVVNYQNPISIDLFIEKKMNSLFNVKFEGGYNLIEFTAVNNHLGTMLHDFSKRDTIRINELRINLLPGIVYGEKVKINLFTGPELGVNVKSDYQGREWGYTILPGEIDPWYSSSFSNYYTDKAKENLNIFSFGLIIGGLVSYELGNHLNLLIGHEYYRRFTNYFKKNSRSHDVFKKLKCKSNSVFLGVSYTF